MAEYYRIKIDDTGKTFIVDEDGNKLDPDKHRHIASSITNTVSRNLYLYMGRNHQTGFYKIGVSNEPDRRAKELEIEIYNTIQCEPWGTYSAFELEKTLHFAYTALGQHIQGEWFELDMIDLLWFDLLSELDTSDAFAACRLMSDSIFDTKIQSRDMIVWVQRFTAPQFPNNKDEPTIYQKFFHLYGHKSYINWIGDNEGGAFLSIVFYQALLKWAKKYLHLQWHQPWLDNEDAKAENLDITAKLVAREIDALEIELMEKEL